MKRTFIIYLFGIVIINIFIYIFDQTLGTLTENVPRTAFFLGRRYYYATFHPWMVLPLHLHRINIYLSFFSCIISTSCFLDLHDLFHFFSISFSLACSIFFYLNFNTYVKGNQLVVILQCLHFFCTNHSH